MKVPFSRTASALDSALLPAIRSAGHRAPKPAGCAASAPVEIAWSPAERTTDGAALERAFER